MAAWTDDFLADGYDWTQNLVMQFVWRGVLERAIVGGNPSMTINLAGSSTSLVTLFGAVEVDTWTFGGTITTGDIYTATITYPGGTTHAVSFTVGTDNTPTGVSTGLQAAWVADGDALAYAAAGGTSTFAVTGSGLNVALTTTGVGTIDKSAGPGNLDLQDWRLWAGLQGIITALLAQPDINFPLNNTGWVVDGYDLVGAAADAGWTGTNTSRMRQDVDGSGFRFAGQTPWFHSVYNSLRDCRNDAGLMTWPLTVTNDGNNWRRKVPRQVDAVAAGVGGGKFDSKGHLVWTSGTADKEGNTIADGMLAWIRLSGAETGMLAKYDGTASLWRYVGQGQGTDDMPDLLDSNLAAPNACLPGAHGPRDYVGAWLIDEMVKVMTKMKRVSRFVFDWSLTALGFSGTSPSDNSEAYNHATSDDPFTAYTDASLAEAAANSATPNPGIAFSHTTIGVIANLYNTPNDPFTADSYTATIQCGQGNFAVAFGSATPPAGTPTITGEVLTYVAVAKPWLAALRWELPDWWTTGSPANSTEYGGSPPSWASENVYELADHTTAYDYTVNGLAIACATLGDDTIPSSPDYPAAVSGAWLEAYKGWEIGGVIMVLDCWSNGNFMYPPR